MTCAMEFFGLDGADDNGEDPGQGAITAPTMKTIAKQRENAGAVAIMTVLRGFWDDNGLCSKLLWLFYILLRRFLLQLIIHTYCVSYLHSYSASQHPKIHYNQ